jgi:2-oxoglutarate dehydrogenase E2 component (dihydrolipoamide succinyltransferase)
LKPEPSHTPQPGGTDVVMPQMGESIFEGTITRWLKKTGDSVQRDEPLFEISTDKVDAEIPAPVSGILTEIKVSEGATVQVNTVVAVIGGETGQAQPDGALHAALLRRRRQANAGGCISPRLSAAPRRGAWPEAGTARIRCLRRCAGSPEHNLDLRRIRGSGSEGRITKDDVLRYPAERESAPAAAVPPAQRPPCRRRDWCRCRGCAASSQGA